MKISSFAADSYIEVVEMVTTLILIPVATLWILGAGFALVMARAAASRTPEPIAQEVAADYERAA